MQSLGIDFGTGNSVLAFWGNGHTQVYKEIGEAGSVPSDVLVREDGYIDSDPSNLDNPQNGFRRERAIKRRLLSLTPAESRERAYLSNLATSRLRYMYNAFLKVATEPIRKAVLTCPANTGQAYRDILLDIGRRVGLPEVDIVDEPTAAAVHHGLSKVASSDERWMVVDWGCGTFDVSLIERRAGKADLIVRCVKGDNGLGGLEMDELLRDYLANAYRFNPAICPPWQVEAIKKRLSDQENAVEVLALDNGHSIEVTVTRHKLEDLITPILRRAEDIITSALTETHWRDVDQVIATGGPMLMPSVRRAVAHAIDWDEEDILWRDPLTSVALEAVMHFERQDWSF